MRNPFSHRRMIIIGVPQVGIKIKKRMSIRKLWVFASHDVTGTNHHATMFDYHVFSTEDLVNWTDHGRVLSVDDVDWAITHAWATDAVQWKDNYYFVFCMRSRENSDLFRIGLAISDHPEGPWLHKYNSKVIIQSYNGDFKLDKVIFKPVVK